MQLVGEKHFFFFMRKLILSSHSYDDNKDTWLFCISTFEEGSDCPQPNAPESLAVQVHPQVLLKFPAAP